MIYICKNCSSESNDMDFGEWCEDCVDISREKIMPDEREYTHDLIWKKYLEDKCPVCDGKVDSDSHYSHTENGGKCMAKYFTCDSCFSRYTVGYNRKRQPIISEITCNTVYKQNKKNMENKEMEPLKIGIHYGLLADPISEQITKQGFICDEKISKFEKTFDSIQVLRFSDLLTDSMYDKILTKFHKQLIRHVAKVNKYKVEAISK